MALLKRLGYQIALATTGKEALAIFEKQEIDLVLMDVLMPEMDGLEATKAIRAGERTTGKHLPIIAMTAGNSSQDVQRCLTAGMDAFVSKPFRQAELFAAIEQFLGKPAKKHNEPTHGAVDWPTALRQVGGRHALLAERVSLLQQELPRVQNDLVTAARPEGGRSNV